MARKCYRYDAEHSRSNALKRWREGFDGLLMRAMEGNAGPLANRILDGEELSRDEREGLAWLILRELQKRPVGRPRGTHDIRLRPRVGRRVARRVRQRREQEREAAGRKRMGNRRLNEIILEEIAVEEALRPRIRGELDVAFICSLLGKNKTPGNSDN